MFVLDGGKNSRVKYVLEVVLRQSRTLQVVASSDPACQPSGPAVGHWFGAALGQVNQDVHILAKVRLGPNQDNWRGPVPGADLWDPFGCNVLEGDGVDQAEAQDEDIHVGITERAKMPKLLL